MDSKREELLDKTYSDYLDLMLYDFPIDRIEELVADDVKGYGTTIDEKFPGINRLQKMVRDQREQGSGFKIHFLHTPVHRRLSPNKDTAIYTDEFLLTMEAEDTKNEIPMRLTSVFEFDKNTWKLVHIHGSQAVETEEDTWHQNVWKRKNEELQRLVEQKTADLEKKNRELEIEAALERVRSRAMIMKELTDMLEICRVISQQLELLNIKDIRNVQTAIINRHKGAYLNYEYYRLHDKKLITEVDYTLHPKHTEWANSMLKGSDSFFTADLKEEELKEWIENQKETSQFVDSYLNDAASLSYYYYSLGPVALGISTYSPLTENDLQIFKRFRNVFELAYKRYEDIKKAEAQAKEARIETALEKIRAQVTAMQESSELLDIVVMMQAEFTRLGHEAHYFWHMRWLPDKYEKALTNGEGTRIGNVLELPRGFHGLQNMMDWEKSDEPSAVFALDPDTAADYIDKMINQGRFQEIDHSAPGPDEVREMGGLTFVMARTTHGEIGYTLPGEIPNPPEEDVATLVRFANVFDLAYRRFEDLQTAEKQHWETQIELALERVRARTITMQKSEELAETAAEMFKQIESLGLHPWSCGFNIFDHDKKTITQWVSSGDGRILSPFETPATENIFIRFYDASKRGEPLYVEEMSGQQLVDHYRYMTSLPAVRTIVDELDKAGIELPTSQVNHAAFYKQGYLMFITYEQVPEFHTIFKRFAKVFEQTYTRFLDLKNAESQARESEIQLALERVRARTMAMHKSEELADTAVVLSDQLRNLNLLHDNSRVFFSLLNTETDTAEVWMTQTYGKFRPGSHHIPLTKEKEIARLYKLWKKNEPLIIRDLSGKKLTDYYDFLKTLPHVTSEEGFRKILDNPPERFILTEGTHKYGTIGITSFEPLSNEAQNVLIRFSKVFEQTYTRFLDLQKAETQAREAQIEAALERVRSRTIGMHKSDELLEIINKMHTEILHLGIDNDGSYIITDLDLENKSQMMNIWVAVAENEYLKKVQIPYVEHKITSDMLNAIHENKDFITNTYSKSEKNSYFDLLYKYTDFNNISSTRKKIIFNAPAWIRSVAYFKNSILVIQRYSAEAFNAEENRVLKRFAKVFEQTYTRFLDLKKAEVQAREATKQASLDRVRGEIASMRNSEDLNRITPVIWRELQALEVPFIRCGVFIIDEEKKNVQVYLTTPDGKALGVLNLALEANELTNNTVEHWRKERIFKTHWNKKEFINWTKSMMELGQVQNAETYQGSSSAPESLNLHFVPFRQGMLYVGDANPLTEDKIDLVKTLAGAFSIAYARYEDFKNLEEAKNKIESTLNELKAAQTQLIQSEKMASLGELTAGIAHEIQNPLNFVNNFSDVSMELLGELKEELVNGDLEEVKTITEDVIQNLEKILHHGKRADEIVKGMLQHSRGSSGQKEPTDINALCDEYLRLSYHGFRAKDKSFNADFKLEMDELLPKIEVVPQDIGRVLLNLINNAFYAVNEKVKQNVNDYKPAVVVITKLLGNKVEIQVQDNGNGIPNSVKEKIFQPFFTTKPTGQGTGLGLSLSYDIVKAHGGTLEVISSEEKARPPARSEYSVGDDPVGRGTEFIIRIPIA